MVHSGLWRENSPLVPEVSEGLSSSRCASPGIDLVGPWPRFKTGTGLFSMAEAVIRIREANLSSARALYDLVLGDFILCASSQITRPNRPLSANLITIRFITSSSNSGSLSSLISSLASVAGGAFNGALVDIFFDLASATAPEVSNVRQ